LDKVINGGTVVFEGTDGGLLIVVHESAVAFNVCTENSGELTLKTFFCHKAPP
jgi:hypothetical protein